MASYILEALKIFHYLKYKTDKNLTLQKCLVNRYLAFDG